MASPVEIPSQSGMWRASASSCASSSRRPEGSRSALTASSMSSMTKPSSSSISSIRPSGPGSGLLRPDLLYRGRCSDPPCPDLVPVMALSAGQGDGSSQLPELPYDYAALRGPGGRGFPAEGVPDAVLLVRAHPAAPRLVVAPGLRRHPGALGHLRHGQPQLLAPGAHHLDDVRVVGLVAVCAARAQGGTPGRRGERRRSSRWTRRRRSSAGAAYRRGRGRGSPARQRCNVAGAAGAVPQGSSLLVWCSFGQVVMVAGRAARPPVPPLLLSAWSICRSDGAVRPGRDSGVAVLPLVALTERSRSGGVYGVAIGEDPGRRRRGA